LTPPNPSVRMAGTKGGRSMSTYIILSKVSPGAFDSPEDFRRLARKVADQIRSECPGLTIRESYSAMGQYDVVDIVECEDPKEVERASMIIRSYGRSATEVLYATRWQEFMEKI